MQFSPLTTEELLACQPRLVRLARALVGDPSRAEDLVQEVNLVALEGRAAPTKPWAWLQGVLRKRWLTQLRDEGRRRDLEADLARTREAIRVPEEEVVEQLRLLMDGIEHLAEPYRATLRARYVEGSSPEQVAADMRVPLRTVHTRTTRGIGKLRSWFELERGREERNWALELSTALGLAAVATTVRTRRLRTVATAAAVSLVAATVVVLALRTPGESEPETVVAEAPTPAPDEAGEAVVAVAEPEAPEPEREPLVEAAPEPEPEPEPVASEPEGYEVAGKIYHVDGSVAEKTFVWFQPGVAIVDPSYDAPLFVTNGPRADVDPVRSDAEGNFEITLPPGVDGRVYAADERHAPIVTERVPTPRQSEVVLIVGERKVCEGRVYGPDGAPLEGAIVRFGPPPDLLLELPGRAASWFPLRGWSATDHEGRFQIIEAYEVDDARLVAVHKVLGLAHARLPLDEPWAPELRFEPFEASVSGRVVHASGQPAIALVTDGRTTRQTDPTGAFQLPLRTTTDQPAGPWKITAVARGAQPASVVVEPGSAVNEVRIVLGPEPLVITGRVVDAEGQGVEGAKVWPQDMTALVHERGFWFVETMIGRSFETLGRYVETDADGAFRIEGLVDREYELMATEGLARRSSKLRFLAGRTDALLRLEELESDSLVGRVVDLEGEPLEGVSITAYLETARHEFPDGRQHFQRQNVRGKTDADGAFEIEELPLGPLEVLVRAPGRMTQALTTEAVGDPDGLDVVMPHAAFVSLRYDPAELGDTRLRILDADGEPLAFEREGEAVLLGHVTYDDFELARATRNPLVLVVPVHAAELVLERDDLTVRSAELALEPGKLATVGF